MCGSDDWTLKCKLTLWFQSWIKTALVNETQTGNNGTPDAEHIHTMAMVSLLTEAQPVVPETLLMDSARLGELHREFAAIVSTATQMTMAAHAIKEPEEVLALLARGEPLEAALATLPDRDTVMRALVQCTSPTDAVWGLM